MKAYISNTHLTKWVSQFVAVNGGVPGSDAEGNAKTEIDALKAEWSSRAPHRAEVVLPAKAVPKAKAADAAVDSKTTDTQAADAPVPLSRAGSIADGFSDSCLCFVSYSSSSRSSKPKTTNKYRYHCVLQGDGEGAPPVGQTNTSSNHPLMPPCGLGH